MRTVLFALMGLLTCANADALPKVGEMAPDFTAVDEQGNTIRLKDLRGSPVVLYSYPKDDTPGCTVEAKQFTEAHKDFQALGAVVLGVSGQDAQSHKEFKQKYGITFPLLVDPERKLMKDYGMWNGVMASRMTVLIGPDGRVAAVWPTVKPDGHDDEVMAELRKLLAAQQKAAPKK
ncbi:MAG: peroxiredoxin [Myxococcota bacterium]